MTEILVICPGVAFGLFNFQVGFIGVKIVQFQVQGGVFKVELAYRQILYAFEFRILKMPAGGQEE